MLLKFITNPAQGPKSIACHHMFDAIEDLHVEDFFYPLATGRGLSEVQLRAGEYNADVNMCFDYRADQPTTGVGPHEHQQVLCFTFTARGKRYRIETEMEAYLLNDQGKTIEKYWPSRG